MKPTFSTHRLTSIVSTTATMKLSSTRLTATRRHGSKIFYRLSLLSSTCASIHWHGTCIRQWERKSWPVNQIVRDCVTGSTAIHACTFMYISCNHALMFAPCIFPATFRFFTAALPRSFSVPMTADDIKDILIPEYNDAGNYSDRQILTCPWHRKLG